jgi:MFS family permease
MLALSLTTAALSYAMLPFTQNVAAMMALMFLLGLGLGAPQPMILTLLHESAPAGRAGEALGLRTTMINTSQTVMPLIFGAVGAALGIAPLFWAMSAALLAGGFFANRLRK